MTAWRTMNIGAFVIILGLTILIVFGAIPGRQDLFLPIILSAYGIWLFVFALLKQLARPNIYEYPPLMVAAWGILIGGAGFLWLGSVLFAGAFTVIALGAFVIVVGVALVAYSIMKK